MTANLPREVEEALLALVRALHESDWRDFRAAQERVRSAISTALTAAEARGAERMRAAAGGVEPECPDYAALAARCENVQATEHALNGAFGDGCVRTLQAIASLRTDFSPLTSAPPSP